jgi:hypothetical protein
VQNQQTYEHPEPPPAVIAVDGLSVGHRATVEGRVREVDDTTSHGQTARVIDIGDDSGDLRVTFSPVVAAPISNPGNCCGSPERRAGPAASPST